MAPACDQKWQGFGWIGIDKAGFFHERKKAFQRIMVIFDSAVSDAGIFKIQDPFKQLGPIDIERIDLKMIFGKLAESLDIEGIGLNGRRGKPVNL